MEKYFTKSEANLFQFYRIPKALFNEKYKGLSCEAKLLYGLLLDTNSLSIENEWFDKEGKIFIYYSREKVMNELCVAKQKAVDLFKQLNKFGLIEEKRQGLGRPNKIYVLKFIFAENVENSKKFENQTSKVLKIKLQKVRKSNPNYTKQNNTKQNYTNNNNTIENLQKENKSKEEVKTIENIENITIDDVLTNQNKLQDKKNIVKISQEEFNSLQEEINLKTKGKIHHEKLTKLINSKGIDKIKFYLTNFQKFQNSKFNAVGYFIKAVENEYSLPSEYNSNYSNQKPIQSTNFTQREIDDYEITLLENWEFMSEEEKEQSREYLRKKGCAL